jgi:hypothetical protein
MAKLRLLLLIFILPLVYGFDRQREQVIANRTRTVVYLDDKKTLGYYKDSISKFGSITQVWLHMPKSSPNSSKAIERMADILIEIECEKRRLRIIKTVDDSGKTVSQGEGRWDFPSPKDEFYRLTLEVCR